jgi:Lar family restriction alleviation protein
MSAAKPLPAIKPCPFCNSARNRIGGAYAGTRYVVCEDCGANGGPCQGDRRAINAWNRRAKA